MAESRDVSRFLRVLGPHDGTCCVLGGRLHSGQRRCAHVFTWGCTRIHSCVCMRARALCTCVCVCGHCAHVRVCMCVSALCVRVRHVHTCACACVRALCTRVCMHVSISTFLERAMDSALLQGRKALGDPDATAGPRSAWEAAVPKAPDPPSCRKRPPSSRATVGEASCGAGSVRSQDQARPPWTSCAQRGGPRGWLLGHSWT